MVAPLACATSAGEPSRSEPGALNARKCGARKIQEWIEPALAKLLEHRAQAAAKWAKTLGR
jgi:hypothetical protein